MTPNEFLNELHRRLNAGDWPEIEEAENCDGDSIFVHPHHGVTFIVKVEEEEIDE